MSLIITVLGSLLVAVLITAPVGVYEYHRNSMKKDELTSRSVISIPNAEPIPVHIPMQSITSPTTYQVPYWLGGYSVTVPSPATWTLPLTYSNGGRTQFGEFLQIRNYGPGVITLVATPPETIESAANYTIPVGSTVKVLSYAPNWIVTTPLATTSDVRYYGAKCDGLTDDTAAIQRAVSAVALTGGVLLFPTSTCMITSIVLQSNVAPVTLRGTGFGSVLQRMAGVTQGLTNMLSVTLASDVTIEGINFVNYANTSIGTLYKDNCVVGTYATRLTVRNCFFSIGYASGILLVQSTRAMITNNHIYEQAEDPANPTLITRASGGIYVVDGSSYATIEGNIIDTGAACLAVQAIAGGGADIVGTAIVGNVVRNCSAYGIILYSLGSLVYDTTVTGNTIEYVYGSKINLAVNAKSFGAGIYVQHADKTTVTGNAIAHTNILTDDETLAPGAIGTANSAAVTISANTIVDPTWYGIYVATSWASSYTESGPIITGNSVTTSNTSSGAIKLNSANNAIISSNQIQTATIGAGIWLRNSTYCQVSDNMMDFPYGYNTGGIYLEATTGVVVRNNYLRSLTTTGTGIVLYVGAGYTTVEGNQIRYGQIGIRVFSGPTTKIQNNYCSGAITPYYFDTSSSFYGQNYGLSSNEIFQGPGAPIRAATVASGILDVGGAVLLQVDGTAAPSITTLRAQTGVQPGQTVSVTNTATSGDITFVYSSTTLRLAGSVNLVLTPKSIVTFLCVNSVAPILWQEVSRTIA